ncbi:aminopeptidase P family protein [Pseudomonas sp. RIT-PI-S]|uniref:aminopeptidase P family protein n=1 Tax=Pseudomonas sp. RIT-PI-S TaxID=3035295 RepID=UPI0021D86680|nr:aminopeptidase P family protein [Pseudomonas sp. RIT-PI-S]
MNPSSRPLASVADRIAAVRALMAREQLDALLVPSADPHLSEYLPGHWQARRWLSGFNGSVGTLVVAGNFAGLWADSRYWEQAERELADTGVVLMKLQPGEPGPLEWLAEQVPEGGRVAVDARVLALQTERSLKQKLDPRGIKLLAERDWLADIWTDRPALPWQPVVAHLAPEATEPVASKLARVRQAMAKAGANAHFIATVDDIAWLFNLRGSDVSYNPVFLSFALVKEQGAVLWVGEGKLAPALQQQLAADGIEVREYAQVTADLAAVDPATRLLIDPARVTAGLISALPVPVQLIEQINPSTLFKASKSEAELAHIRRAMAHDGAALCEFFAWLEAALGQERVTEVTIDEQLLAARARQPGYVCPSFATIAAFAANGALPHYRATEESHSVIEGNGLLLIDSGGQYLGGTTDITRMVPVGEPTQEQKEDCTRVLQGMMALSAARFPEGILTPLLDAIARAPLWAGNVNYGHGTGHGVGYFLNVHEGPQVIAYQAAAAPHTAMREGMITSIEPGTYRPGRWGVRIENLVASRAAGRSEFGEFLCFETLTLCPIDTRCLLPERLAPHERDWLNGYHSLVRERIAPLVSGAALAWLNERTAAI